MHSPARPGILGGMDERDDYDEDDSALSWLRLTEDRVAMWAWLTAAAVLLSATFLVAFLRR